MLLTHTILIKLLDNTINKRKQHLIDQAFFCANKISRNSSVKFSLSSG